MPVRCSTLALALSTAWGAAPALALSTSQDAAGPPPAATVPGQSAAEVVERARDLLADARVARQRADFDGARAGMIRAQDLLSGIPPGMLAPAGEQLLLDVAVLAQEVGELRSARASRERVLLERERRLPPDHPEVARARAVLGVTLSMLGDQRGAQALLLRALETLEGTLPADELELARIRTNLANTLSGLGDLQGARKLQEHVVRVRESALAPDDPDLAKARANLAATLASQGDLRAARSLFERALESLARSLGPEDPDLTRTQVSLASVLRAEGELDRALELQRSALASLERTLPADHPYALAARQNLALTLLARGDLSGARGLLEEVVGILEVRAPADDRGLAATRLALANVLGKLGDLTAERALEERVLDVFERTLPPDNLDLARARSNLANTLRKLGDLPAARALQERALEAFERSSPADGLDLASARMNLANTLRSQGQPALARELEELVLEVRERTLPAGHPDVALARMNLALTLEQLGDATAAHELQQGLLRDLENALPEDHPDLARARLNLGATLSNLGELEAACAFQERALAAGLRTLPPGHPSLALARAHLTMSRAALLGPPGAPDRRAREVELESQALGFVRELRSLVRASLLDGSPREVEERLTAHDGLVAAALALALGNEDQSPSAELVREVFLLNESIRASAMVSARLSALAAEDATAKALLADSRARVEDLARLSQAGSTAEELEAARAAVDRARRDLAVRASQALGSSALLEPTLAALLAGMEAGTACVTWRRSTLPSWSRGEPPAWRYDDHLVAFVARPARRGSPSHADGADARVVLVDLGPFAPIESAIDRWRGLLGAPMERGLGAEAPGADLDGPAHAVRALVLDPLRAELEGVRALVVVLDDALHAVPLDALPADGAWSAGGGAGSLLGAVLGIEVRTALIERLLERHGGSVPALVAIGDPDFDREPSSPPGDVEGESAQVARATRSPADSGVLRGGPWERGFGALPETRGEVRGIARYFEDAFGVDAAAHVLERERASREALVELAPHASWLHVATHGWFARESVRSISDRVDSPTDRRRGLRLEASERVRGMSPMLLCGLALTGANLPPDASGRIPGILTAQELSTLDLGDCELAVLSACDTNVGVRRAGQGVASLQQALHTAGARSVITSLWRVPDAETRELMIDFYRRLWVEKKPKGQALWEAKMHLRGAKDERGRNRHPMRAWAAWVLSGSNG